MAVVLLVVLGVLLAFAGLSAMWFLPGANMGPGPKLVMILFSVSLLLFLAWMIVYVPRLLAGP